MIEQTRNYIVLIIVLILVIGGVYYKKNSNTTPPDLPNPSRPPLIRGGKSFPLTRGMQGGLGEANDVPPDKGELKGVAPEPKLTYDQYLQRGIKYETDGNQNSAIGAYKKAAEISPKEYVPYSNAGSVYYGMGKYSEAEDHFLKALELSPDSVSVYTKLYEVYFYGMKRSPEQMKAFFKDGMENTNNDINIVRLYASYLEQINDPQSALSIWQSLLNFEPENMPYRAKVEALQKKIKGIK
ncbi:MAG: tetratricopeptide repeat protein [Patescibacteria group bacterium]